MKFTDYIFNKAEAIRWITDSEPVLHCNDCKYYNPQTNICEKLLDSRTKKAVEVRFDNHCSFGIKDDLPF